MQGRIHERWRVTLYTLIAAGVLLAWAPISQGAQSSATSATPEPNEMPAMTEPVVAEPEAGQLKIELNKLEPLDSACRAYLLFENRTNEHFISLKLDLVMFDPQGIISRRLAVEGGPLPAGKTSVKLFDIRDLACQSLDRLLLNGVLNCTTPQGERHDCLPMIETTSRASTEFFK